MPIILQRIKVVESDLGASDYLGIQISFNVIKSTDFGSQSKTTSPLTLSCWAAYLTCLCLLSVTGLKNRFWP